MLNICQMLGASFVLVLGMMAILWMIYFVKRNAGLVDIGWGLGFILTVWAYFFIGDGYTPKKLLMAGMVTVWAVRLVRHLYERFIRFKEDARYAEMRQKWGGDPDGVLFLMMFLFQGLLVIILSLPFLIIAHASESTWSVWELVGFLVWIIGVGGESIADAQLQTFKADPANQGKVCEVGWWNFSRHPNYFFEWIIWVGYFIFVLPTPGGWIAIIAPALMLALLLKVSGVPLAEAQSIHNYGDAYRKYQMTTSEFIPWFKKRID